MHLERFSSFANVSNDGDLLGKLEIDIKGREYVISYLDPTNIIFDLSCNNIKGKIPTSISSMSHSRLLNLSHNKLEGQIPHLLEGYLLWSSSTW